MKKLLTLMVSLVFFFSLAITPVWVGGGKVQGENGQGTVDQGDIGSDSGNAPGNDAQDNQV